MKKILFVFAMFLSLSVICKDISKYQLLLDSIRKSNDFPGANLTIILPDDKVIKISSGVSDLKTRKKIDVSDRMFSGSIGKTYVSAVLLLLIEEKKLSLDEPVNTILGQSNILSKVPNYNDLTVKNLMNHTSGIPRHIMVDKFSSSILKNPDKIWKPEELLSYISDKKPLFPAGKGWSYADTNYILIGMIIEKITGNTYYKELNKRILTPYKLKNTSPSIKRNLTGLIQGYTGKALFNFPDQVVKNNKYIVNPQFEWTGGGLISDTYDLALWAKLLYSKKVLKPDTYKTLLQAYSTENGKKSDQGYGLGVEIWNTKSGIVYGHGGLFPGYQSVMKYYSKFNVSIAMQINEDRIRNPKLKKIYDFVDLFIPLIIKELNID